MDAYSIHVISEPPLEGIKHQGFRIAAYLDPSKKNPRK